MAQQQVQAPIANQHNPWASPNAPQMAQPMQNAQMNMAAAYGAPQIPGYTPVVMNTVPYNPNYQQQIGQPQYQQPAYAPQQQYGMQPQFGLQQQQQPHYGMQQQPQQYQQQFQQPMNPSYQQPQQPAAHNPQQ